MIQCVDGPIEQEDSDSGNTEVVRSFMCSAFFVRPRAAGHYGVGGSGPHQAAALRWRVESLRFSRSLA